MSVWLSEYILWEFLDSTPRTNSVLNYEGVHFSGGIYLFAEGVVIDSHVEKSKIEFDFVLFFAAVLLPDVL